MQYSYYLPHNLDIDTLMCEKPHNIKSFKKEKILYILSLINQIILSNKNLVYENFTPINAQLLQKFVDDYKVYLDYLIKDLKIIECDNTYVSGEKSKGYRFIDTYQTTVKPYKVNDWTMRKKMKIRQNDAFLSVKKLNYLTKWFNDDLKIDFIKCYDFLQQEYKLKSQYPELRDYNIIKKKYRKPIIQFNRSLIGMNNINNGYFFLKRDFNVNRFHSNLTNISSELRNAITYKGQNLVSIDISNSQPYISTVLFKKQFWTKEFKNSNLINLYNLSNSSNYYIMLGKTLETLTNKEVCDFSRYTHLVKQGRLYEFLQEELNSKLGLEYSSRKQVKSAVFQTLFTNNRFIHQTDAKPKKLFSELFPNVYELFCIMKEKDKSLLPRLLQSIESYLMIDVIAKRVSKELPKAPIFTIHDSIATTNEYVDRVKEIMIEELTKSIGIAPNLKIEYWNLENMDKHLSNLKERVESNVA